MQISDIAGQLAMLLFYLRLLLVEHNLGLPSVVQQQPLVYLFLSIFVALHLILRALPAVRVCERGRESAVLDVLLYFEDAGHRSLNVAEETVSEVHVEHVRAHNDLGGIAHGRLLFQFDQQGEVLDEGLLCEGVAVVVDARERELRPHVGVGAGHFVNREPALHHGRLHSLVRPVAHLQLEVADLQPDQGHGLSG